MPHHTCIHIADYGAHTHTHTRERTQYLLSIFTHKHLLQNSGRRHNIYVQREKWEWHCIWMVNMPPRYIVSQMTNRSYIAYQSYHWKGFQCAAEQTISISIHKMQYANGPIWTVSGPHTNTFYRRKKYWDEEEWKTNGLYSSLSLLHKFADLMIW